MLVVCASAGSRSRTFLHHAGSGRAVGQRMFLHMTIRSVQHGGNQHAIRKRLGLGERPLLDFSASLNPLGPPPAAIEAARSAVDRSGLYPEPGCPHLTAKL